MARARRRSRRVVPTPGSVAAADRSSRVIRRWLAGLAAIALVPIAVWTAGPRPASPWLGLTTATGLLATSSMVCTVVLVCRPRELSRAFGITRLMYAHRVLGTLTLTLVIAHVGCAVLTDRSNVILLDWAHAPWRGRAGLVAAAAPAALVVLGLLRPAIRRRYELWRAVHIGLAAVALVATACHVVLIGKLVADTAMGWVFSTLTVLAVSAATYRWHGTASRSTEHVVQWVRMDSDTVCTIGLAPVGVPLRHAPGQFAWLRLRRRGLLDEHPFTLASPPTGSHVEITTKSTGDFGAKLRTMRPGTPVWIDGPYGDLTVDDRRSAGWVMVAAGVGITPMMSMLRALAARRDLRPVFLLRVADEAGDLLFAHELAVLATRMDLTVVTVLRRPPPGWTGRTGDIGFQTLSSVLPPGLHRNDLEYFVCGPAGFVTGVHTDLVALGVPARRVHIEQFDRV